MLGYLKAYTDAATRFSGDWTTNTVRTSLIIWMSTFVFLFLFFLRERESWSFDSISSGIYTSPVICLINVALLRDQRLLCRFWWMLQKDCNSTGRLAVELWFGLPNCQKLGSVLTRMSGTCVSSTKDLWDILCLSKIALIVSDAFENLMSRIHPHARRWWIKTSFSIICFALIELQSSCLGIYICGYLLVRLYIVQRMNKILIPMSRWRTSFSTVWQKNR